MVKRWGKSPPRDWQQDRHGKPHPEQCRIGASRGTASDVERRGIPPQGCFSPRGPGWQLDPVRKGGARGMVIQRGKLLGQNPAYRPSAQFGPPRGALPPRPCGLTPGIFAEGKAQDGLSLLQISPPEAATPKPGQPPDLGRRLDAGRPSRLRGTRRGETTACGDSRAISWPGGGFAVDSARTLAKRRASRIFRGNHVSPWQERRLWRNR